MSLPFKHDATRPPLSQVQRDMLWQQAWVRIMRPFGSILKFRLPWTDGCTQYLPLEDIAYFSFLKSFLLSYMKGDIYLPVWGPQTTTESRLVVRQDDADTSISYDHRCVEALFIVKNCNIPNSSYGERMFFFNICRSPSFCAREAQRPSCHISRSVSRVDFYQHDVRGVRVASLISTNLDHNCVLPCSRRAAAGGWRRLLLRLRC